VVRRQHTSEDTGETVDVIDLYPGWNDYGTYGKMKVAHEYLDHDWQRERFEKFSGISVDQLPIYEGQQAMQRRFGMTHKCEVAVRPFCLMLQPRKDENGNYDKTLILKYLPAGRAQQPVESPATAAPTPPPARNGRVNSNGSGSDRQAQSTSTAPVANGRQPRQAPAVTQEPVEFDDLVSAGEQKFADLLLAKQPWFQTEENTRTFRKVLFGEWDAKNETAYWVGMLRYAELRTARQTHQVAKTEALNRYHRELKEINHATNAG
jgi:hypothetical protein